MAGIAAKTLSEAQLRSYQRDGFLVAPELFDAALVAELRETFMAQAHAPRPPKLFDEKHSILGPDDPLKKYPRCMHPHRWPDLPVGPLATRAMLDPKIGAILHDLFGEEALAAQSMFYYKPAGARGQDLHQDNFYLRVKPGTCMAAWIAIDRADRENGGMVAVPGSHRFEISCPEKADNSIFFSEAHVPIPHGYREVPIDLEPGDCLFFNGSVIHGSYPNKSKDRFRRAFICHYVPRRSEEVAHWYRPLLTFDREVVAMNDASGGGPCGEIRVATAPH